MTDELIGKQIGGYEILTRIGQGGMATVYRAQQMSMNRVVALKVLPRQFLNDDTYLQRFEREVKIVSQLEHRNIVPVHDYGQYNGQPYIAMRYMPAGSVDDLLQRGPLALDKALSIIEQIAPALDYAHSKNVLHRDLKPSNVLMDDGGGAYLTDFGIARILGEQGPSITTQGVVGTPSYMSPEQAQAHSLDGRSDIYSLGVMLFEMLTGRRPFESDTPYSIAVMQVTTPPPPPRSFNPLIPTAVEKVILKTLKKTRDDRYPTSAALAQAFREAVETPDKVHDTQPHPIRLPPPAAPALPSVVPVAPLISPPPSPAVPPNTYYTMPTPQSVSYPGTSPSMAGRLRKRRSANPWMSVAVGVLLGCGLLTALVIAGALIISKLTSATPPPTPAAGTAVPGAVVETGTPEVTVPGLDATSETARQTLLPGSRTTVTPLPSTADLGIRPTPTLNPALSSVRGKLVYYDEIDNSYEILTLELHTGIGTRLTDDNSNNTYPLASPDGHWIAFQSNRDGDFDIYVMNPLGGELQKITYNEVIDRLAAWSSDGQWIIFGSNTNGDKSTYDLYRVHPNGSNLELVFGSGQYNSHPRYSPDGRSLVFVSGSANDAGTWRMMRLDIASGSVTKLTPGDAKEWSPTFSPDGRYILYLVYGKGNSAIARMNSDGTDGQILDHGPGYEWGANYSPDGRYIVFSSNATDRDELYLMTADALSVQQITQTGGAYASWVGK